MRFKLLVMALLPVVSWSFFLLAEAMDESQRAHTVCILYAGPQDIPFPTGCFSCKSASSSTALPAKVYLLNASTFHEILKLVETHRVQPDIKVDQDLQHDVSSGYYISKYFENGTSAVIRIRSDQVVALLRQLRRAVYGYTEAVGRLSEIEIVIESLK